MSAKNGNGVDCPNCLAGVRTGRILDAPAARVPMTRLKVVSYKRGLAVLFRCPDCRARFWIEQR